jgi:hypothetical protein
MMVLCEDLVIPAGTEFVCIDGVKRTYCEGNYEALISLSPDLTASLVVPREALVRRPTEAELDALIELVRRS